MGLKTIETRSWPTKYRGWLLICAAKKKDETSLQLLKNPNFPNISQENLNFGKAVALVKLINCVPSEYAKNYIKNYINKELEFGNYDDGRFCWIFDRKKMYKIKPYEIKGSQGFFYVELPLNLIKNKKKIQIEKK
jgi:hypothetical protein